MLFEMSLKGWKNKSLLLPEHLFVLVPEFSFMKLHKDGVQNELNSWSLDPLCIWMVISAL